MPPSPKTRWMRYLPASTAPGRSEVSPYAGWDIHVEVSTRSPPLAWKAWAITISNSAIRGVAASVQACAHLMARPGRDDHRRWRCQGVASSRRDVEFGVVLGANSLAGG